MIIRNSPQEADGGALFAIGLQTFIHSINQLWWPVWQQMRQTPLLAWQQMLQTHL